MAATPPLERGKRPSMTLWPVSRGSSGRRRSAMGRGVRTGHREIMGTERSFPRESRIFATTDDALWNPAGRMESISPSSPAGTRIRCSTREVSLTDARTVPGVTTSPTLPRGVTSQVRSGSIWGTETPRVTKAPSFSRRRARGRPMPSKMEPMRPGPRAMERGPPDPVTGSPTVSPAVSS